MIWDNGEVQGFQGKWNLKDNILEIDFNDINHVMEKDPKSNRFILKTPERNPPSILFDHEDTV